MNTTNGAPLDRWTYLACRITQARFQRYALDLANFAADGLSPDYLGIPTVAELIHPEWLNDVHVMVDDVLAEIGPRPEAHWLRAFNDRARMGPANVQWYQHNSTGECSCADLASALACECEASDEVRSNLAIDEVVGELFVEQMRYSSWYPRPQRS